MFTREQLHSETRNLQFYCGGIVRKASLLFAAVFFLAAGFSSPTYASRCYGNDPCFACKNCSACQHCHVMGGTCGVCGTGKSSTKSNYGSPSTIPISTPSSNASRFRMRSGNFARAASIDDDDAIKGDKSTEPSVPPRRAPSADFLVRPAQGFNSRTSSSIPLAEPDEELSEDLNRFPFNPYTGRPNPNYRGISSDSPGYADETIGSRGRPSSPDIPLRIPIAKPSPYSVPYGNPNFGFSDSQNYSPAFNSGVGQTERVSGYYTKSGKYVQPYFRRPKSH